MNGRPRQTYRCLLRFGGLWLKLPVTCLIAHVSRRSVGVLEARPMLKAWTVQVIAEAGESVVGHHLRTVHKARESSEPATPCSIEEVRPYLVKLNIRAIHSRRIRARTVAGVPRQPVAANPTRTISGRTLFVCLGLAFSCDQQPLRFRTILLLTRAGCTEKHRMTVGAEPRPLVGRTHTAAMTQARQQQPRVGQLARCHARGMRPLTLLVGSHPASVTSARLVVASLCL